MNERATIESLMANFPSQTAMARSIHPNGNDPTQSQFSTSKSSAWPDTSHSSVVDYT